MQSKNYVNDSSTSSKPKTFNVYPDKWVEKVEKGEYK